MRLRASLLFCIVCIVRWSAWAYLDELDAHAWYKLGVATSGVYKITYSKLKSMGVDVDKTHPDFIKIMGPSGGMLSEANSEQPTQSVQEYALWIKGAEDGQFQPEDFILVYIPGPDTWTFDARFNRYRHTKHLYTDSTYILLGVSTQKGKRVMSSSVSPNASVNLTTSDEYIFREDDLYNLFKSGKEWYGSLFDTELKFNFSFNLEAPVSELASFFAFMEKPNAGGQVAFSIRANGQLMHQYTINTSPTCGKYCQQAFDYQTEKYTSFAQPVQDINLEIEFNKSSDPQARAYLNHIELQYSKPLQCGTKPFYFRHRQMSSTGNYSFSFANIPTGSVAWDITSPGTVADLPIVSNTVYASSQGGRVPQLVIFSPDGSFEEPDAAGRVAPVSLKPTTPIDLALVYHPEFAEQASTYAEYKRSKGQQVFMASITDIYNKYTGGGQDPTAIKSFCRDVFHSAGLRNLLLFGNCSYDYKDRIIGNTNFVPTYQSKESLNDVFSYNSDDYFGFLADTLGVWEENESEVNNFKLNIGIGRAPIKSKVEAEIFINKCMQYESASNRGIWQNRLVFLADNADQNIHMSDADRLATKVDTTLRTSNVSKIYIDSYPFESTPSGNKVPLATEALRNEINRGALVVNYTGHGGTTVLAQEQLIDLTFLKSWRNFNQLPLLMTATCNYGAYDNPAIVSGGMTAMLAPKGGAIGVITAGRPVFSNTNYLLNLKFYEALFDRDTLGNWPTLGTVFKNTKNLSTRGRYNRSYALLADPSLTLRYPLHTIKLVSVKNISQNSDTLTALSQVEIKGQVQHMRTGELMKDFDGSVQVEIYDKLQNLKTLGQQNNIPFAYNARTSILYNGRASVTKGEFSLRFVVPKDINYALDRCKISLYAYSPSLNVDAAGYNNDFVLGGSNPHAPSDRTPPSIQLFINDSTFRSGQYTHENPLLLAYLYDENGINISNAAIGHEITARLTGDDSPVILNSFYTSRENSFSSGEVRYNFADLKEGSYTLRLQAWDTHNNANTAEIQFLVGNSAKAIISRLMAYPNPARDYTTLVVEHNLAGKEVEVLLEVINNSGKQVWSRSTFLPASESTLQVPWNILEDGVYNLSPGWYVYRCTLKSMEGGEKDIKVEKLVLTR